MINRIVLFFHSKGNTLVDERELRCIAHDLGAEWESVATYLDFTASEIQKFKISRPHQEITYAIFDMLVEWRGRREQTLVNQRECLSSALEKCGRLDLTQNVVTGKCCSLKWAGGP